MTIGVPKETTAGEQRVALTPDVVGRLTKQGFSVVVEKGAGATAHYPDPAYAEAGAQLTDQAAAFGADLVVKVQTPTSAEMGLFKQGQTLLSFLRPLDDLDGMQALAKQGVTALSMEMVPRITRAQKMDALSAMSTVAGYQAVLQCAQLLPKFFPLLTTAAGTIRPAKVLVIGAGVAGLQALATARRLGASTFAYDVRAAAREEAESLGAKFVELELETADAAESSGYAKALAEEKQKRQVELMVPHVGGSDVVISTALIPGRPAPLIISEDAIKAMAPGSVVMDLAAPNGGNCALTKSGETVHAHGVRIVGPLNLPTEMPFHASQMYARTLLAAIGEFSQEGALAADFENEIFQSMCVTHGGAVVHERVKSMLAA